MPTIEFAEEGLVIDEPVSSAVAMQVMPVATATAEPPLLPPGVRARLYAL